MINKYINSSKILSRYNDIKTENNYLTEKNKLDNNFDNEDEKQMFTNRNSIRSKYKKINNISKSQNYREIKNPKNINDLNYPEKNILEIKVNRKENLIIQKNNTNKKSKYNNIKLNYDNDNDNDINREYLKYRALKDSQKNISLNLEECILKPGSSKFMFYKRLKNKNLITKKEDNDQDLYSKESLITNKNKTQTNKCKDKDKIKNICSLIFLMKNNNDKKKKITNNNNNKYNCQYNVYKSMGNLIETSKNNEDDNEENTKREKKEFKEKEKEKIKGKTHNKKINIINKHKKQITDDMKINKNSIFTDNLSIFKRNFKNFRIVIPKIENDYKTNIEKEEQSKIEKDNIDNNEEDKKFEITGKEFKKNLELYEEIYIKLSKIIKKTDLPSFNMKNYEILEQIGDGTYGIIYEVVHKETNKKYAMKKILAHTPEKLQHFLKEFEISHSNPHNNIISIFGMYIKCIAKTKYLLYILMDLAENDWDKEIIERAKNNKYYTEKELITILKQITSALVYLQRDRHIAHRDIKPENILIFDKKTYKLCDFGEAKIEPDLKKSNSLRGTEIYMSPVLYTNLKNGIKKIQHDIYKSDVFSFGYCFLYAASLNYNIIHAIRDLKFQGLVNKMLDKYMKEKYSDEFIGIISKMINVDEKERIDFIELDKIINEKYTDI